MAAHQLAVGVDPPADDVGGRVRGGQDRPPGERVRADPLGLVRTAASFAAAGSAASSGTAVASCSSARACCRSSSAPSSGPRPSNAPYTTGRVTPASRAIDSTETPSYPHLIAAVDKTQGIYVRPRTRYDRTLRHFALVAFGDRWSTAQAADILVKVHSKAIGDDPVTGQRYDANAPHSQLWIHLTAWHSILYAYERYGPVGCPRRRSRATGRSARSPPTCRPATRPTCPGRARGSGSTSRRCGPGSPAARPRRRRWPTCSRRT
jgi:hypothetical protein